MSAKLPQEVTQLLQAWCQGDKAAFDQLIPLVYDELHRLAHKMMMREPAGNLLQTTALVNEAYMRLIDANRVEWQSRAHFLAISAKLMRRILVDLARSRRFRKRHVTLVDIPIELHQGQSPPPQTNVDLIALNDSLQLLESFDPRGAKVIELRFFGGLSVEETAEVLGVSPKTVKRDWAAARVWLLKEMRDGGEG
jgi:RNA polymerase sigma factor (TIGR02999 family)